MATITPESSSNVPASSSTLPVAALEVPAPELASRLAEVSDDFILCTDINGQRIYAVTLGAVRKLAFHVLSVMKGLDAPLAEEGNP